MNEKRMFIFYLSQFDLPASKVEMIIDKMEGNYTFSNFCRLNFDFISSQLQSKMLELTDERFVKAYIENLDTLGINLICKLDREFPKKLLGIEDCPFFLFYKGDLSLLNMPSIAIVGTRMPTSYGRMVTEKFSSALAKNNVAIISGLAYGIDTIAHRQSLDVGGKTIAVLGCGINNIYPADHQNLANTIAQKGLLLSEYCPSTKATRYSFPARNRIIAGLSDGVLITEAGIKSGTLYTRDYALDFGKDVFAVPGNINNEKSMLPNEIICTGQGMGVTSPEQILQALKIDVKDNKSVDAIQLSFEEDLICKALQSSPQKIEDLTIKTGLSINNLNSYLTILEIRGIITRMLGGEYCLK